MVVFEHPARSVLRRPLQAFLASAQASLRLPDEVTCLITSDRELRRLNKQFLGKDYATDVLSFPPADMAISYDRAKEQARDCGHSVDEEIRVLILHGLLHLSGMDHEADQGEMARVEKRWRKKLGLPVGLIERAS